MMYNLFPKVGSHLVQPLLAMVVELNRRQSELCALLRKKDLEIMDYKESGVRLSRSKDYICVIIAVFIRTVTSGCCNFSWSNLMLNWSSLFQKASEPRSLTRIPLKAK